MGVLRAVSLTAASGLLLVLSLASSACEQVGGVDFGAASLRDEQGASPQTQNAPCGQSCADLGFECGNQFDPCGNPRDCGTCADGKTCDNGKCGCAPKLCKDVGEGGAQCGAALDGCGGALDCGKCANPNHACQDANCECKPKGCQEQGAECGTVPDGCGGTYACPACTDSAKPNCGGGGPNKCGVAPCVPKSCVEQGKNCGSISDGCGNVLECGGCTDPQSCGGGGVVNVCGCRPTTCAAHGKNCGSIPDGCGGILDCGACTQPSSCQGGGVPNVCGCTSNGSCSTCCGGGTDNCGRACTRSTCCGGGGGGCFGAGTLVRMADGSMKAIEQVRPGELVASYDRVTHTTIIARVTAALVHGPETSAAGFVVLDGPNGKLRVTPNHPVIIDGVVQRAEALRAGSAVVTPGKLRATAATFDPSVIDMAVRSTVVDAVDLKPGNGEPTYDLKVEGPGTFFAAGILVRQKPVEPQEPLE